MLQEGVMCLPPTGEARKSDSRYQAHPHAHVLDGPQTAPMVASPRATPPYIWPRAAAPYSYCIPTLRVCVSHIEWVKPISQPPRRTLKRTNPL